MGGCRAAYSRWVAAKLTCLVPAGSGEVVPAPLLLQLQCGGAGVVAAVLHEASGVLQHHRSTSWCQGQGGRELAVGGSSCGIAAHPCQPVDMAFWLLLPLLLLPLAFARKAEGGHCWAYRVAPIPLGFRTLQPWAVVLCAWSLELGRCLTLPLNHQLNPSMGEITLASMTTGVACPDSGLAPA
ncbi:hypothetical protein V8C86DRAFT_2856586 [Haematococcus lacustris]